MGLNDTIANVIRSVGNSSLGAEITFIRNKQLDDTLDNFDPVTGKLKNIQSRVTVKVVAFSGLRRDEVPNADKNELNVVIAPFADFKLERDDEVIIFERTYQIVQISDIIAGPGIAGHKLTLRV